LITAWRGVLISSEETMKRVALIIALLVPTAAMAKGECAEDKQKFCKDVVAAKGDVRECLNQHASELSEPCKKRKETKAKRATKTGKEEKAEPTPGPEPKNDTKIDQPTPGDDATKQ
jgi:hypothetical protein